MNLFVYGTLMNRDKRREVLGRETREEPAVLENYLLIRTSPNFGNYPIAISQEGKTVHGLLISGLENSDFETLDAYEGLDEPTCPYHRFVVKVRLHNGASVNTAVYAKRNQMIREA